MIGTTLGHFRILSKLSDTGSGEVYRAEDESLRRQVTLEVLSPALASDPDHKARFLNAARAAAAVTHPNLAAIHEVGESHDRVWVAMELVDGATLRTRLRGRPLSLLDTLKIGEQVAEGLAAAHEKALAHGDLRAEKVRLGPGGQVKVVELGLAAATADPREDVYRLGAMLHEMATGRPPASEPAGAPGMANMALPLALNPELPVELDRIIAACLEPDPRDRYQHAGPIAADLGGLRRGIDAAAVPVTGAHVRARRQAPGRAGRIAAWSAAGVALTVILGFAAWRAWGGGGNGAPVFKPGERILVADFVNETADVEIGVALRDVFEGAFDQYVSSRLFVVERDTMKDPTVLDAAGAEARCLAGECAGFVRGSIAAAAGEYRLTIALHRAGSARPVIDRVAHGDEKAIGNALLGAMTALGRDLETRSGAGMPPGLLPCLGFVWSGDRNGLLAAQAALRARRYGWEHGAESLALIRRALDLDPGNPSYYFGMGMHISDALGRRREAIPLLKESWQRFAAAAERHPECREDGLHAEIDYLERAWGHEMQLERLNRAVQLYPDNGDFWFILGLTTYRIMGDPEAALPHIRKAYDLSPHFFRYLNLFLLAAGKLDDLDSLIADYRRRAEFVPGDREELIARAQVLQAYVRGEEYEAIVAMIDRFEAEGRAVGSRHAFLSRAGRLAEAEAAARKAADLRATRAVRAGQDVREPYLLLDWLEKRRTGRVRELDADDQAIYLADYQNFRTLPEISIDLGTAHPLAEILRTVEQEQGDNPNRIVQDAIRYGHGCLALIEGRASEAVAALKPLAAEYGPASYMAPQHALGRAYEAVGRWKDAAAAYEAVLGDPRPYSVWDTLLPPVFVLEQHRLAGIYERLGNTERARYWYGRFLHEWRNADPGMPEVEDAKRRLAALGGPLPEAS